MFCCLITIVISNLYTMVYYANHESAKNKITYDIFCKTMVDHVLDTVKLMLNKINNANSDTLTYLNALEFVEYMSVNGVLLNYIVMLSNHPYDPKTFYQNLSSRCMIRVVIEHVVLLHHQILSADIDSEFKVYFQNKMNHYKDRIDDYMKKFNKYMTGTGLEF